jgi:hypothetical protein
MLKYENSTLKIYIRTIKNYTDIDPTVDFVFPVNKIDRKNSGKNSLFILTLWSCPSSLQLLLPVKQTIFFSDRDFQSAGKKSAKIKCLLFSPKPQKFHTAEITGYTVTKMLFNVALTVVTITLNLWMGKRCIQILQFNKNLICITGFREISSVSQE